MAGITGNTYSGMTGNATPEYAVLALGGLGIGVVARAKYGHEDAGLPHLARGTINHRDRLPSVVNEDLLPCAVLLTQRYIELALPLPVELAEPAVPVPLGAGLPVLLPEELKRYALPAKLPVDILKIGQCPPGGLVLHGRRVYKPLEGPFIEVPGQGPGKTGSERGLCIR